MDLQLKNRTCLVTGASVGIGHGIAKAMAAEGARVAVTARRGELLEGLADEVAATGAERPLVIAVDLTETEAPDRIKQAVLGEFGKLDILVNNAGASRSVAPDAPDEVWDESFALNFTATRRLTQAFLPAMREQKWGRIINITGNMEPFGTNAAQAAKAAVHVWAKCLSRDLGGEGITVNCVPPGRINSEQILERVYPTEEGRRAFADAHIPAGYFGEPEDLACLVVFLASPLARYINGEVIHVDGGMRRFAH